MTDNGSFSGENGEWATNVPDDDQLIPGTDLGFLRLQLART